MEKRTTTTTTTNTNKQQHTQPSKTLNGGVSCVTSSRVFLVHLISGLSLSAAFWIARNVYSVNLISNPSHTLSLIWEIQAAVVIILYSLLRHDHTKCSYLRAAFRGLLSLPFGATINAFGAIVLGAPAIHHFSRTVSWSLLMSVLTVVPATAVYGLSWADWHRLFAQTKPDSPRDYMICLPAHGAVIGAWFGAWPMPLDWERPWQEWPICVTYGAITGYLIGMVASFAFSLCHNRKQQHVKGD